MLRIEANKLFNLWLPCLSIAQFLSVYHRFYTLNCVQNVNLLPFINMKRKLALNGIFVNIDAEVPDRLHKRNTRLSETVTTEMDRLYLQ